MTQRATHTCHLCEALCGIEVEHDGQRVLSIRGDEADVLSRGHICPKAAALKDLHEDPDRLRQPMRRRGDGFVAISWDEALNEAATRLHSIRQTGGKHSVGLYVGNPSVHSYGTLFGYLMLDQVLHTRSRFSATSIDQLPHMFASLAMFGHQLLLPVPDLDRTDLFVIVGGNPAVSNGSLMTAPGMPRRLKALRARGGKVVVIDPRRTETADLADEHHFVRPGSDALLLLAVLQVLFAEGRVDDTGAWRGFTDGYGTIAGIAARFTPERVAPAVGMEAAAIRNLARQVSDATSCAFYGRLGISTQRFGGLSAWLVNVINVVTGNLDRPGGMMFTSPAADLVALGKAIGQSGHFDVWRSRVRGLPEFNGELPAQTLAEEIETPGEDRIRALVCIAGNPVLSTPNGARLAGALGKLDFMVSVDPYITATSRHADLILPGLSPLERDHFGIAFHALSVRNTVKYSERVFEPPPGALSDFQILAGIAERFSRLEGGLKAQVRSGLLGAVRRFGPRRAIDLILMGGPHGIARNPLGRRLTVDKLVAQPHGIDLGPLEPCLPERLYTEGKRVALAPDVLVADIARLEGALDSGELEPNGALLLIGRRHLRSNNSWMHNSKRLVKGKARCTLQMNPDDAASRGLSSGDQVAVTSRVGEVSVPCEVDDRMMPGVVSLPHGWGHKKKGAQLQVANAAGGESVNDLTDEAFYDELTGTAALSGVPVTVSAV